MKRANTAGSVDARLDLPSMLMVRFLESQGQALLAQETVEEFQSRRGGEEEEEEEDELQSCIRPYKKFQVGL